MRRAGRAATPGVGALIGARHRLPDWCSPECLRLAHFHTTRVLLGLVGQLVRGSATATRRTALLRATAGMDAAFALSFPSAQAEIVRIAGGERTHMPSFQDLAAENANIR